MRDVRITNSVTYQQDGLCYVCKNSRLSCTPATLFSQLPPKETVSISYLLWVQALTLDAGRLARVHDIVLCPYSMHKTGIA